MNPKINSGHVAGIPPISFIHRLVHFFLLISIAVLFVLPYVNKTLIITIYETLQPVTSKVAGIFFLSDLYGRASSNLIEITAYAAIAYILILALHTNFLIAIRRQLVSTSTITENVQLSWGEYLCRFFYSRLSPMFSLHCASSVINQKHRKELSHISDRVQLTRGMSHREVTRSFLSTRGSSLKEEYLVSFLVLVLFLILYWALLNKRPDRFGSLFHYGATMVLVYAQIYLVTEIVLMAILYFAPHKKEKFE